jgi:hypothetical protein
MVTPRAVRRCLWFLGVLGLVLGLAFLYRRTFAGHLLASAPSPGGRCAAEVRTYGLTSATDTEVIAVRLRCGRSPLRHEVFSGLDYGSGVSLHWASERELEIHYRRDRLGPPYRETTWRDISIRYILE